ncbi:MAG TPA: hypothetical protein VLP43_10175 [Solirubrobacteraceae bacterium]|nr:hypothetical protein [Solirubrobacteraceae bacterium]
MKTRPILALLAAAVAGGTGASPAAARVIELGATSTAPLVAPTCPPGVSATNCTIILTQETALETIRANVAYPTTVKQAGYVVAFTVGLSQLNTNRSKALQAIKFLNATYGGTAQAAITVLKPVGSKRLRQWQVAGESPAFHLSQYLGEVVQIPLATALRVVPGETIGLTVPTWAPVLSFNLPLKSYAYRQSRSTGCPKPAVTSHAQTVVGAPAVAYNCNYAGARIEYTATEVTSPLPACPTSTSTTKTPSTSCTKVG